MVSNFWVSKHPTFVCRRAFFLFLFILSSSEHMDSKVRFEANLFSQTYQHKSWIQQFWCTFFRLLSFSPPLNQTSQESITESAAETELNTSVIHACPMSPTLQSVVWSVWLHSFFCKSLRPGSYSTVLLMQPHCVFWNWISFVLIWDFDHLSCVPSNLEPNLGWRLSLSESDSTIWSLHSVMTTISVLNTRFQELC